MFFVYGSSNLMIILRQKNFKKLGSVVGHYVVFSVQVSSEQDQTALEKSSLASLTQTKWPGNLLGREDFHRACNFYSGTWFLILLTMKHLLRCETTYWKKLYQVEMSLTLFFFWRRRESKSVGGEELEWGGKGERERMREREGNSVSRIYCFLVRITERAKLNKEEL